MSDLHDEVLDSLRREEDGKPNPVVRFFKGLARGAVEALALPVDFVKAAASEPPLPLVTKSGVRAYRTSSPTAATFVAGTEPFEVAERTVRTLRESLPVEGTAGGLGFAVSVLIPSTKAALNVGEKAATRIVRAIERGSVPKSLDRLYLQTVGTYHGSKDPFGLLSTGLAGSKHVYRVTDELGDPLIRTSASPRTAYTMPYYPNPYIFRVRFRRGALDRTIRLREEKGARRFVNLFRSGPPHFPPGAFPPNILRANRVSVVDARNALDRIYEETGLPVRLSSMESQISVYRPGAVRSLTLYKVKPLPYKPLPWLVSFFKPGDRIARVYLDRLGRPVRYKVLNEKEFVEFIKKKSKEEPLF